MPEEEGEDEPYPDTHHPGHDHEGQKTNVGEGLDTEGISKQSGSNTKDPGILQTNWINISTMRLKFVLLGGI